MSAGFQGRHFILYSGTGNARFDSFNQSANFAIGFLQIALRTVAADILFGCLPVHFSVQFVDERFDQFWMHQLIPEPIQHLCFQHIAP